MATSCAALPFSTTVLRQACRQPKYPYLFTSLRRTYKSAASPTPSQPPQAEAKSHIDDYYALLLEQPLTSSAATERPIYPAVNVGQSSKPSTQPDPLDKKLDKARIIFGSKLAGPAMRQKYIEDLPSLQAAGQGTYIAGIWIPPKPTEPDNCCMSGCVNCVWDGYREELEEWVKRRRNARELAAKQRENSIADAAGKSDEDGIGSDQFTLDNAMDEIPVGIREFMKTEKRLQQQRRKMMA